MSDTDSSSRSLLLDMDCEFFSEYEHNATDAEDAEHNSDIEIRRNFGKINPYMFEPVRDHSDSEESLGAPGLGRMDDRRKENTDWCECGQCTSLPTVEECSCCKENSTILDKMEEVEREGLLPIQCITQHPGFRNVCCNRWVLQTAYFQYRQQYGVGDLAGEAVNRRYRYTAYRQFVRWCWGYLGRKVRVPLPACAVTVIRDAFPSEEFSGFKYPIL